MSITVRLDSRARTLLYYEFTEDWNWTEFHLAFRRGLALIEGSTSQVDSIFDLCRIQQVPEKLFIHLQVICDALPANAGKLIFVTDYPPLCTALNRARHFDDNIDQVLLLALTPEEARTLAGIQSVTAQVRAAS